MDAEVCREFLFISWIWQNLQALPESLLSSGMKDQLPPPLHLPPNLNLHHLHHLPLHILLEDQLHPHLHHRHLHLLLQ